MERDVLTGETQKIECIYIVDLRKYTVIFFGLFWWIQCEYDLVLPIQLTMNRNSYIFIIFFIKRIGITNPFDFTVDSKLICRHFWWHNQLKYCHILLRTFVLLGQYCQPNYHLGNSVWKWNCKYVNSKSKEKESERDNKFYTFTLHPIIFQLHMIDVANFMHILFSMAFSMFNFSINEKKKNDNEREREIHTFREFIVVCCSYTADLW